ncbi:hypothetical protein BU16DRAFT_567043 [Lophium mytilinum]|uniref:NYN domain-containing protein n=1 Tax=Lophium mytilinum TaxID=390894 RepID=A0A6A6QD79_9PEZI|nr:hypothetical protein BU16DRAFT_567043 [Lophium mytilinum]
MASDVASAGQSTQPNGIIRVYIDDSNVFLGGQSHRNQPNWRAHRSTWRYDPEKLTTALVKETDMVSNPPYDLKVNVYRSVQDDLWTAFQNHGGVEVETFERGYHSGTEKQVDTAIVAASVEDACEDNHSGRKSEFIIVSGDLDMLPGIEKIIKKKRTVHVWSWNECLARGLERTDLPIQIHSLDTTATEFGYHEDPDPCRWGINCRYGFSCQYGHSKEDMEHFRQKTFARN